MAQARPLWLSIVLICIYFLRPSDITNFSKKPFSREIPSYYILCIHQAPWDRGIKFSCFSRSAHEALEGEQHKARARPPGQGAQAPGAGLMARALSSPPQHWHWLFLAMLGMCLYLSLDRSP